MTISQLVRVLRKRGSCARTLLILLAIISKTDIDHINLRVTKTRKGCVCREGLNEEITRGIHERHRLSGQRFGN